MYKLDILDSTSNLVLFSTKIDLELTTKSLEDEAKVAFNFIIDNPVLWWPHTQGEPHLYHFRAELRSVKNQVKLSEKSFRYGIRTVKHIQKEDEEGS